MNLSKDKVTEIFYFADNFCKEFYKSIEAHAIEESGKARREPRRKPKMSSGEVVCRHMRGEFPQTVSYNRFVELMEKEALSMAVMLKMFFPDQHTGRDDCVPLLPKEACDKVRGGDHQPALIVLNSSVLYCMDYAAAETAAPMAVASPYLYSPTTIQNRTRVSTKKEYIFRARRYTLFVWLCISAKTAYSDNTFR